MIFDKVIAVVVVGGIGLIAAGYLPYLKPSTTTSYFTEDEEARLNDKVRSMYREAKENVPRWTRESEEAVLIAKANTKIAAENYCRALGNEGSASRASRCWNDVRGGCTERNDCQAPY